MARSPAPDERPTRERLLDTARELFYREGFRAIGVDAIVAESGIAKTSLYRWFPTKDDLIVAVLESLDADFWAQWEAVSDRHEGRPREELRAQLRWIAQYIAGPRCRGCTFLNAAAEFPDPAHPVRAIVLRNKKLLRKRLLQLAMAMGASDAGLLADQLVLMIDGAYAGSEALGKTGPARALLEAAEAAIDGALAKKGSPRR